MQAISLNGTEVSPVNILTKFRDAFEDFTPGENWALSQAPGDIVQVDGNAVGASYLVVSQDPLTTGGVTTLESTGAFDLPLEASVGLSLSQRILGQEVSVEFVSAEAPLAPPAEIDIAAISQTTTTLTVDTATPHGLAPGMRIGIYGCENSRFNYPSLVVASIPTPTRITVTTTPVGALTSLTLVGPTNSGKIYARSALGFARNGFSQIFENTTITNASFYTRSASGDVFPSGALTGAHAVTVLSVASVQGVNAANTFAFLPTTEYRFAMQADRVQAYDSVVDTPTAQTSRVLRTQVVPDADVPYKLRFRVTSNKALTVPVARILSVSKTATTTATVETDQPHGLTVSDVVTLYGVQDQSRFAASATGAAVASVLSPTSFTVVWGAAYTVVSQGGFVARVQGSNSPACFVLQAVQQASVSAGVITLQGTGSWAGVLIGDYVNLHGCIAPGGSLGLDGAYRVRNVVTNSLELEPIGPTPVPADLLATACGGAIIKRSDMRLHFVRVFDYLRQRVEMLPRPDAAAAVGVNVVGGALSSVASVTSAWLGSPQPVADVASAALTATTSTAALTPTYGPAQIVSVFVTAASGTNRALDLVVQESDNTGTNWYDVYHFPRIDSVGEYRSAPIVMRGNRLRYVQNVSGTSPSFTRSISRLQTNISSPLQMQFMDRALAVNTLNSVTPSWLIDGSADLNLAVVMGAVTTTAPTLCLEVSPDGAAWFQVGADVDTAANTNALLQASDIFGRFARVRVKTAGVGATLGYLMVKGMGR